MAIAYDSGSISDANGVTQNTWAHTCTGANRILIVGVQFGTSQDIVGVPTYAGVNMTAIGSYLSVGGATFDRVYLYYLVAPATGVNNIVINGTPSGYIYAAAASYTGVNQTTPIDVYGSTTGTTTSLSKSLTTTVDNDWLVSYLVTGTYASGTIGVGANTTARQNQTQWNAIGDSNSAQTPAGAHSQTWSNTTSTLMGLLVVAISPSASLPTANPAFLWNMV